MLRGTPRFVRFIASAFGVFVLCATTAHAGNDDGVLIGTDAALTGGAVTAIAGDGTATWYNPAGLAWVRRNQVDVSGSAFMVRIVTTPRLLTLGESHAGDESVQFLSIPAAVTYGREISPDVKFGFGLFVPRVSNASLEAQLESTGSGRTELRLLSITDKTTETWGGLAFAWRAKPELSIGAALLAVYREDSSYGQVWAGVPGDPAMPASGAFVAASGEQLSQTVGLGISAGLQWHPNPSWSFGASIRSPGLQIGGLSRGIGARGVGAPSAHFFMSDRAASQLHFDVGVFAPFSVRAGVAHHFGDGHLVSLDASLATPLSNPSLGINREMLVNVRVGARAKIDPLMTVGGGLFTDLSPDIVANETSGTDAEERIHYIGGSIGIEFGNVHHLAPGARAENVTFMSTIAIRYAYGFGDKRGIRFDPANLLSTEGVLVSASVHEFALQLGSGLYF